MAESRRIDLTARSRAALPAHAEAQHAESLVRARPAAALRPLAGGQVLQPALTLGPVDDPLEREAERTADAVMSRGARPADRGGVAASLSRVQRATGKGEPETKKAEDDDKKRVQKAPATSGPDRVPAPVEAQIEAMGSGGEPLAAETRAFFEPRFGADFGGVRVHTGATAASAANTLGARAFTVGQHVFFAPGQYQPASHTGRHLLAHELTHTLQQAPARVLRDSLLGDYDPRVMALAKVREWAGKLPPYELLTVLLGRDPITDKQVDKSPRNLVHAALVLVPDGMAIFDDLEAKGTITKTAAWFDDEVDKLKLSWDGIKALFTQAWDAVSLSNAVVNPGEEWAKVEAIFGPTLKRIGTFALNVGGKVVEFIRTTVLGKIAAWAKEQKGYTLLTFVLGKDPVTDDKVERTATGFAKAILELVPGGDEIYANLEKTKTIERTYEWLVDEIKQLDLSWEDIKELFTKAWDTFEVADLLKPLALLEKLADIFVPPAKRVIKFAVAVGKKVLEFIFEGAMAIAGPIGVQIVGIVRKIGQTFTKIVEDPIGFVENLVAAVKKGFQQFGDNIWTHLKAGLIGWLVGTLEGAGLVLPEVWDLKGILSLTLQILGITYPKMRAKIVKVLGEKTVQRLETTFEIVRLLVTEGPAAAWEQIVAGIGSLWEMVIGGIKEWAVTKIVVAAITKLATMFNPAGAVIQAIIAIYNTVAFFIERIKQITALVEAVVDSVASIADGKLAAAANYVEKSMARTIPVILGFLARLIGLGDVSGAVKKVITAIQTTVDKAIDKAIDWVVQQAKKLFGGKDEKADPKWDAGVAGIRAALAKAEDDGEKLDSSALAALVPTWKTTFEFNSLTVENSGGGRRIKGAMSPERDVASLGPDGSKENPFPIEYPKPMGKYRNIYLGDATSSETKQEELAVQWQDATQRRAKNLKQYVPFPSGGQTLPDGTEIGVRGEYVLEKDKLIGPLARSKTPGGGKINSVLHPYGYRAKGAGLDGDHVWEIQLGGVDDLKNLWPLDKGINRSAGSLINQMDIVTPGGKTKKVVELKENPGRYWFKIVGFRSL